MRLLGCILALGCVTLFLGTSTGCRKKAPPPVVEEAKVEEKKPEPPPPPPKKEEKPDPKAPKERQGLVYNVRMAAMRPETQNDMKQIGTFYQTELATNSEPKTVEEMKRSLKGASRILKRIDDGDYVINLHGKKLQPNEILAYEYEAGSPSGFCVVRANGEVEPNLPYDQLKKELGLK